MKKKISWVFGLLLCLLAFPLMVSADVGMPDVKAYEVVVTDKDGIELRDDYSKKSVVIPYDTKLKVTYEYYDNASGKAKGYIEYQGVSGDIDLSKTKMVNEKVNLKDYDKLDKTRKLHALDDIPMFKGPSRVYGRVAGDKVIPKGEDIEYQYYNEIWAYVEYDGVKGWIYIYQHGSLNSDLYNDVAYYPEGANKVYLTEDVKELKVSYKGDETVKVNIPKDTELTYLYSHKKTKEENLYVEYKGVKGWLLITMYTGPYESVGVIQDDCVTGLVTSDNVYTYSRRGDSKSKTSKKLPIWSPVEIYYSYYLDNESWYYLKVDGKENWVRVDDYDSLSVNYGTVYSYKIKKEATVYKTPDKDAEKVGSIPADKEVDKYYAYSDKNYKYGDKYYSWAYVEYDDIEGWVLEDNLQYVDKDPKNFCGVSNNQDPEDDDKDKKGDKDDDEKKESLSITQMAMIGVGGAVALALVVIVIIALINKKKKKETNI